MKTKVLLIRHGETEWNVLGKFQGGKDINLSENGFKQAEILSERYKKSFDYIYASPLKRAFETAKILASSSGKEPLLANNLREISFGEWEGLTLKEIEENYSEEFKIWKTDKIEAPIVGGDLSIKKASLRAANNIMEIVKAHKGSTIAIVAHGGIIKAGLIAILGWDMNMYHKMVLGNTSVSEIRFDENLNPMLITLNDTNHLAQSIKSKSFV